MAGSERPKAQVGGSVDYSTLRGLRVSFVRLGPPGHQTQNGDQRQGQLGEAHFDSSFMPKLK